MTAALAGYRMVDLTGELGVLCPRLFAGMGCEVVRVEPPGGDPLRRLRGEGWWAQQMAGRKSVTLDLRDPGGVQRFRELVATADFVVESRPAGELAALSLDYANFADSNQGLIWVSITPFGRTGPKAYWRATDLVGMAAGGLLYLCGDRDRPPVRVTAEQAYAQAGIQAASGAMTAIMVRNRFGLGQLVDVSMQAAVTNTLGNARLYYALDGTINERAGGGRSFGAIGTRLIYPSSDGFIAFSRLPESYAVLHNWMLESRFEPHFDPVLWATMPGAGRGTPPKEMTAAFDADLEPFFRSKPTAELYIEGQRRGLMVCPVSAIADLDDNEQLGERRWFVELPLPEESRTIRVPGAPFRMSETPWHANRAPRPGEHNRELFA